MNIQKVFFLIAFCLVLSNCSNKQLLRQTDEISSTEQQAVNQKKKEDLNELTIAESCLKTYETIKNKQLETEFKQEVCSKVSAPPPQCKSHEGRKLFHYDKFSKNPNAKNILVFATFHGDESEGSIVASHWIKRLENIKSRNTWRILPIMNPDGALRNTRTNYNGVDLNRNFPTNDWNNLANLFWKNKAKSSPRRFPGQAAGSESETQCAIYHIEEFKPDFVIAIHTPYGILDFDGPSLHLPDFAHLRWHSLGTFPGSLGRYMWKDRNIPVLTVELRANDKILDIPEKMDSLQDLSGKAAILVSKYLKKFKVN